MSNFCAAEGYRRHGRLKLPNINIFEHRLINSRLFKFIVVGTIGSLPTEYLACEEAIVSLSGPLYALMKGAVWARAACTTWKEVSKETFERSVQPAYIGDYSIPGPREWKKAAEPITNAFVHLALSSASEPVSSKIEGEKTGDSLDKL